MSRFVRVARVAVLALACWCLGSESLAVAARFALLVGNDEGRAPDVRLRFAESDAVRMRDVLGRLGGFAAPDTVVVVGREAGAFRDALAELAARLRATPGEHVVVVFYSGHADAQALHLGASTFPMTELREAVASLPAALRLLVLDACQAGVVTRAKGGTAAPGFTTTLQDAQHTRGLAIMAASAASELAQESDELGGAIFTHYLRTGLAGLGDANGDGAVSLAEAFDYASRRTLAATVGTKAGPQHPTFHFDLEGTGDLALTRPGVRGAGYGQVRLDTPGWYFIRRGDGTIAAEVVSRGSDLVALDAGAYEFTRRGHDSLEVASLRLDEGNVVAVSRVPTRLVAFGRLVRKGGGPERAYGLSVAAAARTPLLDLGVPLGFGLAARVDTSLLSLELRLRVGRSAADEPHLSSQTWESGASLAALRMRDFGGAARGAFVTVGAGLEAGLSSFRQTMDTGERHSSFAPHAGPTAVVEWALGHRSYVRGELSAPVYLMRTVVDGRERASLHPALATALGAGAWF